MYQVFLGIGGNLGNKRENLKKALHLIDTEAGAILKKSSVYETPPWGFVAKENFWNMVVQISTELSPLELLQVTKKIEQRFGRNQIDKNYSSRKMDIDVLFIDELIIQNGILKIPHPRIEGRLFVLVPLAEIAPDKLHPVLQKTSSELLESCNDNSEIKKIDF